LSIPGGQPYLRSVADPDDVYSPLHHWQVSLGFDAIGRALGMTATPTLMQRIGDTIVVTAASTDLATPPEVVTLQASEFGEKVNTAVAPPPGMPRTLPSTRFDVVPAPGGVLLDGRAFGHSIGMSQWGAYGKAARGMKAPDILAAYYGGLKPLATPVAGLADATMRVAVGVDLQTAEVDAGAGAVRMVAGDGAVIAYAARGPWQVKPEGTRLRVVPPTDQLAAQPVAQVSTSPAEPHPGQPITVKVHLPEPAVVTATATAPNAEVVTLADPQLLAAGDVALHLPPAATSGQYAIAVTTDLGGGRTSTTTLVVPIGSEGSSAPRRAATRVLKTGTSAPAERGAPHGAAIALALLALIGVAVTTLRFGARSRSPLH
jgi:hypothetical protein